MCGQDRRADGEAVDGSRAEPVFERARPTRRACRRNRARRARTAPAGRRHRALPRVASAASSVALEHDVDVGQHGDGVGIASRRGAAVTDLADDAGSPTPASSRVHEHQIGERSRRSAARGRCVASTATIGMTLRRTWRDRRAAHTEEAALEVDVVQLVAIDEATGRLVADHGVVLPAVPETHDDVDRLFRLRVELGARRRILAPEVRGFRLRGRHRDLPSGASEADVVERGHVLRARGTARCGWWSPSGTSPIECVTGATPSVSNASRLHAAAVRTPPPPPARLRTRTSRRR